ncbi:MAG: GNAT family N-acetyltransferase [Oligoflexales bacterium]|nr:GNAT family N-acetyltransferase [Oligoflexales bacterium]
MFEVRHELLQSMLRGQDIQRPYPIEEEYPLVLSRHGAEYSICVQEGGRLLAHANFFPRTVSKESQTYRLALIGNVATHPDYQRRGLMRSLFAQLETKAVEEKLHALLLWSDLSSFYQKLGFRSFGQELRFTYTKQSLVSSPHFNCFWKFVDHETVQDLSCLLSLRAQRGYTLDRSLKDFRTLLQIPDTALMMARDDKGDIQAYAVLGKGCDMLGVVHEWGATDPRVLLSCLSWLFSMNAIPHLLLLCPQNLDVDILDFFSTFATGVEKHPLVLAKILPLGASSSLFLQESFENNFFIWGLDGI